MSEWQKALVAASCLPTAVLVNAGSSSLRACWWNGGSEEIGGEPPIGAMSRGGRKLLMMIDREEKRSVSYAIAATSSYRVGSQAPPNRSVRAIGQRCRRSSWIGYGSADHSGSRWEKSVAQSETGPVMISLRVPSISSSPVSGVSWVNWVKRSSTAMSPLLEQLDGVLGAVENGQAGVALRLGRHGAVGQNLPVALFVVSEQAGGEVVAAAVPLAEPGIDLHLHCAAPHLGCSVPA